VVKEEEKRVGKRVKSRLDTDPLLSNESWCQSRDIPQSKTISPLIVFKDIFTYIDF